MVVLCGFRDKGIYILILPTLTVYHTESQVQVNLPTYSRFA